MVLQSHSFLVSYKELYMSQTASQKPVALQHFLITATILGMWHNRLQAVAVPDYLLNLFLPFRIHSLPVFWPHQHSCIAKGRVAETRTMAFNDSGGQNWYNVYHMERQG